MCGEKTTLKRQDLNPGPFEPESNIILLSPQATI